LKVYQVQKNTITPKFGLRFFFSLRQKRKESEKGDSHVTFYTWHPTLKGLFSLNIARENGNPEPCSST
jgi:hypothetical protein